MHLFVKKHMHKTFIYDGLGRASWRSRGIDRAENGPERDQISLQSVLFFKKMARGNIDFAWEWHRFGISNSKNAWEWHRFDAKTLESGIVFEFTNFRESNRLRNASFLSSKKQKRLRVVSFLRFWAPDCRIRGIPHDDDDDDDSPGYHHPPTPSRPGKKYVVRPGSSLR